MSYGRYRLLTDILKKAHFAYSDPVNLDTLRSAQAYAISEYGKNTFGGCIHILNEKQPNGVAT